MHKFLVFFGAMGSLLASESARITNVFVHHGPTRERIVFYLDKVPEIAQNKNKITLANTTIAQELFKHLKTNGQNDWYQVHAKNAKKNLVITIKKTHTPLTVSFETRTNIHGKPTVGITVQKQKPEQDTSAGQAPQAHTSLIALDPGHGGHDNGAQANGIVEKDINLAVAQGIAQELQKSNIPHFLTRTDDTFVPLDARTSQANRKQATLFISIHANADKDPNKRGIMVFYESAKSKNYAQIFFDALHAEIPELPGIGVKRALSQVLYGTCMPSVLIELGFVTNVHDAQKLKDTLIQKKFTQIIANQIAELNKI